MEGLTFLQDMAIVMITSAVIMIICHRLRLPVVLGYILAGILIGPHTPPFPLITDIHSIHILSELGITFLLFSIGLEFSLTKLAKVGIVAFIAASLEIFFMIFFGFALGQAFGWNLMDSLFLGAILSISSTIIIAKVLIQTKKLDEDFAQVILGILIIEDLLAIIIIAVLSGIAVTGTFTFHEISVSMLKVLGFVLGTLFFGFLLVPRILKYVERFQIAEMMTVVVLGLCLGVSLLAAKAGFSIALGAFLIGAIIAETKQVHDIIIKMEPIRDMFTAIFFVSVGMLIDPSILGNFWQPILWITLVTIIGKVISCSTATFLTGYTTEKSLTVGLGLAQIGEFSFIISQLGRDMEVTSPFLYPIVVSVSAITTVTTPLLMKNSTSIIRGFNHVAPKPLITFMNLYAPWISKIKGGVVSSRKKKLILGRLKYFLPRLFLYLLASALIYWMGLKLRVYFDLIPDWLFWSFDLVFMIPFIVGFVSVLDKILWEVLFLNWINSKGEVSNTKGTGLVFHNLLRFIFVFGCGMLFVMIASLFIAPVHMVVAIFILILISGFFLWESMSDLHEYIEKAILSVLDIEKPMKEHEAQQTHDDLVHLIAEDYPLEFETQDFILSYHESAVNQKIKALELRSKTGVSIVGIYRGSESIPNPSVETELLPGDVLLLMGSRDQIKVGIEYLKVKMKEKKTSG